MKQSLYIAYSFLTNGSAPQSFIGASWLVALLKYAPSSAKRGLALRVLGLSPHYFLRIANPDYEKLSHKQFLEAEFERNIKGREKIYREILGRFLRPTDVVLDYGCGPGFLSRAAAPNVKEIYALDISRGALECAKILNNAENIRYLCALNGEKEQIKDNSLDAVYSFAVIQHVTDEIFEGILDFCFKKLKTGGRLILQVQLEKGGWRSEEDWKNDKSLAGRIKYSQGLHCFVRTPESTRQMVAKAGFQNIEFKNINEIVTEDFDDICQTPLLLATKP